MTLNLQIQKIWLDRAICLGFIILSIINYTLRTKTWNFVSYVLIRYFKIMDFRRSFQMEVYSLLPPSSFPLFWLLLLLLYFFFSFFLSISELPSLSVSLLSLFCCLSSQAKTAYNTNWTASFINPSSYFQSFVNLYKNKTKFCFSLVSQFYFLNCFPNIHTTGIDNSWGHIEGKKWDRSPPFFFFNNLGICHIHAAAQLQERRREWHAWKCPGILPVWYWDDIQNI